MALLADMVERLKALPLKAGFRVVELGDQRLPPIGALRPFTKDFYRALGCSAYVSIDGNARGTLTWDLNRPLPADVGTFDLVTDFGTGEHIFDQAQIWRTLHDLCAVGGYVVWDRPTQGYQTHGYYCIDGCLFDDLATANGYRVLLRETRPTPRGLLARGIWQRRTAAPFVVPQQGRYRSSLKV